MDYEEIILNDIKINDALKHMQKLPLLFCVFGNTSVLMSKYAR